MTDSKSVSIVIPVYNASEYLSETVESFLRQTYDNWEMILVNDGSTDDSLDIIKKYSAQDSRIRYIDKQNEGISKTKEAGLRIATGDYLLFFDNDDIIYPEALSTLVNIAEANDADIVATPFYLWYEDGHREKSKRLDFDVITGAGYLNMLFCDKAHWPLWANFMKMELVRMADVDFNFRLGIGEDMVTLAQIIRSDSKVVSCPVPLIDYRMRAKSESHKISRQFYNDYRECLAISDRLLAPTEIYWHVNKSIEKAYIQRCLYGIFWGFDDTVEEDLKSARKILFRHPSAWKMLDKEMKKIVRQYLICPRKAIDTAHAIARQNAGKEYNM